MLSYILPFIILILIVVFIHEYGHYYFAKKFGVGVTDFSIGFGKEIFGWNDKSGTRWKICWIPLGVYVKFFGDRNVYSQADHKEILEKYSEEDQKKLFTLKPLYQRSLIEFRKDRLIQTRKVFRNEEEIKNHILFIKKEIAVSNKSQRMIELKNWMDRIN